ncbi:MAG: GTP-binding protein, partial [Candidatus Omnitrophica bacterium]|nr:GTP-binding protein [Candidatus Omnitrophota bacterium]
MAQDKIRNIMLMGHSHSGKTQLSEAMVYAGGLIPKPGSVDEGTTISDYNDDEKERKISINCSMLNTVFNDIKVNIIDTPGYGDFIGEVLSGVKVVESAVVVVNAVGGVEIGTNQAFKIIEEEKLPAVIFINRIDKEHADFFKCVNALKDKFGKKLVIITYPVGKESSLKSVSNLITKEGLNDLEGDDKGKAEKFSESLMENVAETDDKLLEKYLDQGTLGADEVSGAMKKGILERKIIPVLAGSAALGIGVKELMNFVAEDMPSPAEAPPREALDSKTNEKISIKGDEDFFSAQVFKTVSDPYVGQISIFRVFSGSLSSNSSFYNVTKKNSEKISQIFTLQGKEQKQVDRVYAGDIAACTKLKDTSTGDSLGTEQKPVLFDQLKFPEPAISFSIKPKSRSDEDKISGALHKLTVEDIAFKVVRDTQTKELVVSGMGDLHLNIMIARLKQRFGVDVDIGTPKI